MKSFFYIILFWGISQISNAQNFERITLSDSPDEYYIALKPASKNIIGALILLPGFAQAAESIFPETKIQNVAYENGLLTIALPCPPKLYADSIVISKLNKTLADVKRRYNLQADQFIIGGFSAGGSIALRYTEYCYEYPNRSAIKPKGVFSVDSPVDLFHIWDYFERELNRNFSEAGTSEASYVQNLMIEEIGKPEENETTYQKLTPFEMDRETPGNEVYLSNIAVRVYHDLDVNWLINQRHRSLRDTNAFPASEMINRLIQQGNNKAEFMMAKQAGVRSSGRRHPHSWSIVDEASLVQWAIKLL